MGAQAVDDTGAPAASRPFWPLVGSAGNAATLAVTNSSQSVSLSGAIPQKGCQARIACYSTAGNIPVHIRLDGAAATTSDMLMLPGTVEVFQLNNGGGVTAILDSGTSGTSINVTLGFGV